MSETDVTAEQVDDRLCDYDEEIADLEDQINDWMAERDAFAEAAYDHDAITSAS
jgi:hypothetical protein